MSGEPGGRQGLHFPYWSRGGAEPASPTHGACVFPAALAGSAAGRSWVSSGTPGVSAGTPGQRLCWQELRLLRTRWGFGFRVTWGSVHSSGDWVSWWKEKKVRKNGEVRRSFLCATHSSSGDPEGLGVESCFSEFSVRCKCYPGSVFGMWCPVFPALFLWGCPPLGTFSCIKGLHPWGLDSGISVLFLCSGSGLGFGFGFGC